MYDAFDSYLSRSTWHTSHDLDTQAFHNSLSKVVHDPAFSPDAMGQYFRTQKNISMNNNAQKELNEMIERRVIEAFAIQEYLARHV